MSYILYRKINSDISDSIEALLVQQGVDFTSHDTQHIKITASHVQDLLEMLGMWAVDLVEKEHPLWHDSCLNEESDDQEIIDFIVNNPSAMKDAIVIKDQSRAIIANPPENVFSLF